MCPYINADEIKKSSLCSDLEAAQFAENIREALLEVNEEFAFETELSTRRNLDLLKRAKQKGYFIRCIYVLTKNSSINVARVAARMASGGHGVPENKIRSRYVKALQLLPELISICDICRIYDTSKEPFRIFKKERKQLSSGRIHIGRRILKDSQEEICKAIYSCDIPCTKSYDH